MKLIDIKNSFSKYVLWRIVHWLNRFLQNLYFGVFKKSFYIITFLLLGQNGFGDYQEQPQPNYPQYSEQEFSYQQYPEYTDQNEIFNQYGPGQSIFVPVFNQKAAKKNMYDRKGFQIRKNKTENSNLF